MSPEVSQEPSKPMSPENFNALDDAEKKELLTKEYIVTIDPDTAERSCGDGRLATNSKSPFVKNFGASVGAASVDFISSWENDTKTTFQESLRTSFKRLKDAGHDLGAHRDDHNHASEEFSGCGFADNRINIINRIADTDPQEFQSIVSSVFSEIYGDIIDKNQGLWNEIMANYREIAAAQRADDALVPKGEEIISKLEDEDPSVLELTGEHEEYALIFNYAPGTTLDTNRLVNDGGAAFCVDVWDALAQTKDLGIEDTEAKLIYMAEWVATALVLVTDKGKEMPPVFHVTADYLNDIQHQK